MTVLNNRMIEMAHGGVIFDIGSFEGMYIPLMSEKATQVYAFEPHPENLSNLYRYETIFNNVKIVPAAVCDKTGEIDFFPSVHSGAQHTAALPVVAAQQWGHTFTNRIIVQSYTIDAFCKNNNITNLRGIKIDVEGAEELVFLGAKETLTNHNPIISLETHSPVDVDNLKNIILSYGYTIFDSEFIKTDEMLRDRAYLLLKV